MATRQQRRRAERNGRRRPVVQPVEGPSRAQRRSAEWRAKEQRPDIRVTHAEVRNPEPPFQIVLSDQQRMRGCVCGWLVICSADEVDSKFAEHLAEVRRGQ